MVSYYNTNGLKGRGLFDSEQRAKTQEDIILEIFRNISDATPFEVQEILAIGGKVYPITSIRRAITNLTKGGKLRKTNIRRIGEYGQMNYAWTLDKGCLSI